MSIPDSVTFIGKNAFGICSALKALTIPDSVTEIEDGAFYACRNLTLIVGRNSYAEQYCREHELPYGYAE